MTLNLRTFDELQWGQIISYSLDGCYRFSMASPHAMHSQESFQSRKHHLRLLAGNVTQYATPLTKASTTGPVPGRSARPCATRWGFGVQWNDYVQLSNRSYGKRMVMESCRLKRRTQRGHKLILLSIIFHWRRPGGIGCVSNLGMTAIA